MTWSVTHTIPYNSNADNHSAMVYLFDTVLAGKTGWTISAHPGGQSYRRRAKFTTNNRVTNSNYTMYSWVDWQSTTPTSIVWYEDSVFTTTPGDTATNTTTSFDPQFSWQTQGESWKFCSSDVNPQSVLVLKGGKIAFYWPGITTGVFWPDTTWTAGSQNKGTWVSPAIGWYYNSLMVANAPVGTSTNGTEYPMSPDAGWAPDATANGFRLGGNYISTNFNWLYTRQGNWPFPDSSSHVAFSNGGHTDAGVWLPSSIANANDSRQPFNYNTNGMTMQIGSNYWYNSYTDLGRQSVIFNFGTTDPLA